MEGSIPNGSLMFLLEDVCPVVLILHPADHAEVFLFRLGHQLCG